MNVITAVFCMGTFSHISWSFHGLCMGFSRAIYRLPTGYPWATHGIRMGFPHGLPMGYPWATHGLATNPNLNPMGYPRDAHA